MTVTRDDGSTSVTSNTPTTGTDANGNAYEQTKTSQETKDKNGNKQTTEQITRDTFDKSGKKIRHVSVTVGTTTSAGGGYTQTIVIDDNGKKSGGQLIFDPATGTWKTKKLDPDTGKFYNAAYAPPVDLAGDFAAMTGHAEDGNLGTDPVALPPYAGPYAEIVLTVASNPPEGGAQGTLVLTEDEQGHTSYHRVFADPTGRIVITAALTSGVLKAFSLVRSVDAHGVPNIASRCEIGNPSHIPGTDTVAHPPANGLAITETNSSTQPGDLVRVHIAGNDPLNTRFTLDGKPVRALGVSNDSAIFQVPQDTPLATHQLVMESNGKQSNAIGIAVVSLVAEPLGPSRPGVVQTITIRVNGLSPGQQAQMFFEIGGAATMLDGSTAATQPVVNGIVRLNVRGTQAGKALLRFHLKVLSTQFV